MRDYTKFYIDGQWVQPTGVTTLDVINPANEEVCGKISMGTAEHVDQAARAARKAFATYSQTSVEERVELLERIIVEYQKRYGDMADAITEEMGAPASLAQRAQAAMGVAHLQTAVGVLKSFKFVEDRGPTRLVKEPIGVCGMIHPLELAGEPESPARSPRPWPWAAPWCSSPPKWRLSPATSGPRSCMPPGCRPGCSTW